MKVKMKKTASGVLLVMTLSLTWILSSFVVPVVGITEMAAEAAKKNLAPGTKHVSARTATIHIDVTVGGVSAVHKLEFDDDGLITKSEVFTLSK